MDNDAIARIMPVLEHASLAWRMPWVEEDVSRKRDPFRVLVACILSLRTKDETTAVASNRLFALADTPETLAALPVETVEKAIYPVGFYRNKARAILDISNTLAAGHAGHDAGQVPDTMEGLLSLRGVGRKTANLVLSAGFGKPAICVDTHVHRITNRWGYVSTKTPDETETALREKLPPRFWKPINRLLVMFGQNVCKPVSPICSACPIGELCERVGVGKAR
jgi:endonuclease-3